MRVLPLGVNSLMHREAIWTEAPSHGRINSISIALLGGLQLLEYWGLLQK